MIDLIYWAKGVVANNFPLTVKFRLEEIRDDPPFAKRKILWLKWGHAFFSESQ
jgi:hypothetical protein